MQRQSQYVRRWYNCKHARRIREDRCFYERYLLPRLKHVFAVNGWPEPRARALEIERVGRHSDSDEEGDHAQSLFRNVRCGSVQACNRPARLFGFDATLLIVCTELTLITHCCDCWHAVGPGGGGLCMQCVGSSVC